MCMRVHTCKASFLHEGGDDHRCYGAEVPDLAIVPVVDQVVLVHANAMVGGAQPVAILVDLETNIELRPLASVKER